MSECDTIYAATTITVTATGTSTVNVTGNTIICSGQSTTLTVNGAINSVWTPATGLSSTNSLIVTATPSSPTTYSISGTENNGCPYNISGDIAVNPVPVITFSTSANTCTGGAATVSASVVGAGTYTYLWSLAGNTNAVITGIPAGSYSLVVTDVNGCSSLATVSVSPSLPPLTVTLTVSDVSCNGGSNGSVSSNTSGGGGGYVYVWNNGMTGNIITGLSAGPYSLIVTDVNGCTTTQNIVMNDPQLLTVTISSATIVCAGQQVNLTATALGGTTLYSYNWSAGNTNSILSSGITSNTIYNIIVTDNNGCTAITSTTIVIYPPLQVSFTGQDSGCAPVCVDFSNTTANSVFCSWDFGDGNTSAICNASHCYTLPGNYSVLLTITDVNGCSSTLTKPNLIAVYPYPSAGFLMNQGSSTTNPTITFTDQSLGAISWSWSFGDVLNSTSTLQNTQFTYQDTGTYIVRLIISNQYECTDTIIQVLYVQPEFAIYVPNTFTPGGDGINELFYPKGVGVDWGTLEMWIFDRWGNLIYETTNLKGWDGKANGGKNIAQIDSYVWKIAVKDIFGSTHRLVGHVNLIR